MDIIIIAVVWLGGVFLLAILTGMVMNIFNATVAKVEDLLRIPLSRRSRRL